MWRKLPLAARVYILVLTAAGALAVLHSVYSLFATPIGPGWFILALLTLVSGSATLKLPTLPATISVSETFVFTSVLLFGPAAGTLIVALDALVISLWSLRHKNPLYKVLFNVLALPIAIWLGSHVFFLLSGTRPLVVQPDVIRIPELLFPLLSFTVVYFVLNSSIIAIAIALEKRVSAFRIWKENFAWISLNYFGGASVAALLVGYTRNLEFSQLAIIVPLLLVSYLTFAASMGRAEDTNKHLIQLNQLYVSTIETLATAIDAKDQVTHGHIRRVQVYAIGLARTVGLTDEGQIRAIEAAALLHDMGKLAVPDHILNKPGPLTSSEFDTMKLHASIGAEILSSIEFPYPVVPIVRHHHENWDGTGYPDGLKGTEIPIGARILAVVDCFDALTSDRPYRRRLSDTDALNMLRSRRGQMYDPLVVDAFIQIYPELTKSLPTAPLGEPFFPKITDTSPGVQNRPTLWREPVGEPPLKSAASLVHALIHSARSQGTLAFYEYDSGQGVLIPIASTGELSAVVSNEAIRLGTRVSGWVAASRTAVLDADAALEWATPSSAFAGYRCTALPVMLGDELLGVLTRYVGAESTLEGSGPSVPQLEELAHQIARLLARTRRDNSLGLGGDVRHLLLNVFRSASSQGGSLVSVVLIRTRTLVDENIGLIRGITDCTRGSDHLFRWSDNELLLVLPGIGKLDVERIAGRIATRRVLGQMEFTLGWATTSEPAQDPDELVIAARASIVDPAAFFLPPVRLGKAGTQGT